MWRVWFLCMVLRPVDWLFQLFARFWYRSRRVPPIDDPLLALPAVTLANRVRSGRLTSTALVQAYIDRIRLVQPVINAVVGDRFDEALAEARDLDEQLAAARQNGTFEQSSFNDSKQTPFLGVPMSVKESFQVRSLRQTAGLVMQAARPLAESDAPPVDQMVRAGAIPVCVTNVSEICMWWESSNCLFGRTLNPYDTSRMVGGSSGGEGALIAAGGPPVGIGTDIGGSIRMPAHFCGIFGHYPTPTSVSNDGRFPPLSGDKWRMVSGGPMCRYAADLLPALATMIQPDARARLALDRSVDVRQLRFFRLDSFGDTSAPISPVCPEQREALSRACRAIESGCGVSVKSVCFDEFRFSHEIYIQRGLSLGGDPFSVVLALGKPVERVRPVTELLRKLFAASVHTVPILLVALAADLSAASNPSAGLALLETLRKKLLDSLGDDGVLILPTNPNQALYHHQAILRFFDYSYTGIFNALGFPSCCCPMGLINGLPTSVQVVSRPNNDRLCVAVAGFLESANAGWTPP